LAVLTIAWWRTLNRCPNAGGEPAALKGRFVVVSKPVGGAWVYVADHASVDPPPPAPAAAK